MLRRLPRFLLFVMLAVSLVATKPAPARALPPVEILVDVNQDTNDPAYQVCSEAVNDCSLRGAVSRANADASAFYRIRIPAGTYALNQPGTAEDANHTGDFDLTRSMDLIGAGAQSTIIDGKAIDRVMQIRGAVTVNIQALTITGGKAPAGTAASPIGADGGGINIDISATVNIQDAQITKNAAGDGYSCFIWGSWEGSSCSNGGTGGYGGGIFNDGSLTLTNTIVAENASGNGGRGGDAGHATNGTALSVGRSGGMGGKGGGIFSEGAYLRITGSTIRDNKTGKGGNGGAGNQTYSRTGQGGSGGNGGSGAGIASQGTELTIRNTIISANFAGPGGTGGDDSYAGTLGGAGGKGGSGGGIFQPYSAKVLIDGCQITGNYSGAGGAGGTPSDYATYGLGGSGGDGGGMLATGKAEISRTIFLENGTSNSGPNGGTGATNKGGLGGALSVQTETAGETTAINNSIFARNQVAGQGAGSAVYLASPANLVNNTFVQNTGGDTSAVSAAASFSLTNTIIACQGVGASIASGSTAQVSSTLWADLDCTPGKKSIGAGPFTEQKAFTGSPAFVSFAGKDYHITAQSAAVDKGEAVDLKVDLDKEARPGGAAFDLGADEYYSSSKPVYLPAVLGPK